MFFLFQPQHGLPDMFIWLLSGTKRLAYQRISARHLLYSMTEEEKGKNSGSLQTLFLKVELLTQYVLEGQEFFNYSSLIQIA